MTEVWPDMNTENWWGKCPRCSVVVGPCASGFEAEVEADTHCPGDGGGILVTVGGGNPTDSLYTEVS